MEYLVAKLVTGEIVVGLAGEPGDDFLQLTYPFEVYKETTYDGEATVTRTMLRPYCPYTDDQVFILQMRHTIYVSALKESLVEVYKNMVDAFVEVDSQPAPPEEPLKSFVVDAVDTIQ